MRLLQEPILSLEQRIKQEIEENPALEEATGLEDDADLPQEGDEDDLTPEPDEDSGEEMDLSMEENSEFSIEDYLEDDEIPEYRLIADNKDPNEESREIPVISSVSFQDYLLAQLGMNKISDQQFIIAANIIGNLDDAGYLRREITALVDDLAFNQNLHTTPEEVETVLKMVQDFDPPGIAARDLQECLLIQLEKIPGKSESVQNSLIIVRDYFNEFSRKHYDKIISRMRITPDQLREAVEEIQKLNPKPGGTITEISRDHQYIIPDFIIHNDEGELELILNSRNTPELILNRQYVEMLHSFSRQKTKATASERAAMTFIKQKIDAARGFIEAIKQRQHTLFTTMNAIMEYQKEYFLTGDETKLRPMILKDIATRVSLDISTISRVANSKYVQTPFGTFLLKSFFSEGMQNVKGEEVSTREIKRILLDAIESEDKTKPFNDDELVDILKAKGYNVARRTINKYRKQLNIPVARLRIEI